MVHRRKNRVNHIYVNGEADEFVSAAQTADTAARGEKCSVPHPRNEPRVDWHRIFHALMKLTNKCHQMENTALVFCFFLIYRPTQW